MATPAPVTQALVDALNVKFASNSEFTIVTGRRFDKVARISTEFGPGGQTFVFMFVERETGGIYKAAGWKLPAKGERFRVTENPEEINELVQKAVGANNRPTSAFLYLR